MIFHLEGIDKRVHKYFSNDSPAHWLYGYLSEKRDRVDTLLRDAETLTVRNARETIGNSQCDVVDYSSPYGRGTLWFDPAHGYLLAQAEVYLGPGHYSTDDVKLEGEGGIHFSLSEATFKKVEGVWFSTGATVVTDLTIPEARELRTSYPRITNIRLDPVLEELDLFSKSAVRDGARVLYMGLRNSGNLYWKNGKVVDIKQK